MRLAVDENEAAALLHDAIYRRQSKPGTLGTLRGEERLEDARLRLVVHSDAGVADGQHDVLARHQRCVRPGKDLVERDVGRLNRQLAALRHGVARVHRQIHDDLVNLPRVRTQRAEAGSGNHHQIDIFPDHPRQHFQVFGHHFIQVENLRRKHLLAAECQQLPRQ